MSCKCNCCESERVHTHGAECENECGEDSVKLTLIKLIPAIMLFAASWLFDEAGIICRVLCFLAYLLVGAEVLIEAAKELIKEHSIDECFLMGIASIGAMAIGEFREAAAVMIFYCIGELLEDVADERSKKSIVALLDLRPDSVNVIKDGKVVSVSPESVAAGDRVLISAGERIAVDGVIISGDTEIDNSALTGESLPVGAGVGDMVFGGGINLSGTIEIRVEKAYNESSGARILELVKNSQERKAKTERFISKFARIYTICIVAAALVIAFVCPIFTGYSESFTSWLYKGLILLVASCPCALVISVPLSFFAGVGCASRNGILIKGAGYIEQLEKTETAVFDKTGTLTKGELSVDEVCGDSNTLEILAACESHSSHPIALAVLKAYGKEVPLGTAVSISEMPGKGITAEIDGVRYYCGNKRLMNELGISYGADNPAKTCVYVASETRLIGYVTLADEVRSDSCDAVSELKRLGVKKTVMLTGDSEDSSARIADAVGIDEYKFSLSPSDKVSELSKLLQTSKNTTVYAGDGINDSPVIALADVGIAMGGLGSDAAIETADVVILNDMPSKIPLAIKISKRTVAIAKQNIAFAIAVKIAVISFGLAGYCGMWAAVFADVGVTVIAVLNALRALRYKEK